MKAAIYARYSTDLQAAVSVDDQFRVCEERAEAESWTVVERFADRGISGASLIRPGIQDLLQHALVGKFDLVIAEALDRISRDQEDIAGIYKRLKFAGVKLVTLSEGPISELHIGLKGTMNAMFLKDLADKTRRGLRGRVELGKSGGGNAFGYDVVRKTDAMGEPIRGDRKINESEADIVRRIYAHYAGGKSPRAIAHLLNAEGVKGPSGKTWGPSTIHGNKDRGTGILNNELYVGRLVWNRLRYIKDPDTGKRVSRLNPEEKLVTKDVPDLRIVPQELWERVKVRQDSVALGKSTKNQEVGFWDRRRPRYLLSGLVKCAECGSGYAKISQSHFGCAGARNKGTCNNRKSVRRDILEETVLRGLQDRLMTEEHLDLFCKEYTKELNASRAAARTTHHQQVARLSRITHELDRLIDALIEGVPAERVKTRMHALEVEKSELELIIEAEPAETLTFLHPSMGDVYKNSVMNLRQALSTQDGQTEATDLLRSLIDRIVVHPPNEDTADVLIDIEGDFAGILSASHKSKKAAGLSPNDLVQIKLVAGVGIGQARTNNLIAMSV
jgi:site-specific DNA recombinase